MQVGLDRELAITVPGWRGHGDLWTGSWRWWDHRPRVAFSFAMPHVGTLPGVWRVEGSWEAQTYGALAGVRPDGPFGRNALTVVSLSRTGSTAISGTSSPRGSTRGTARVELRLSAPCSIADWRAIGCRLPPMLPLGCR